jgi:hypothetical protein
MNHRPISRSLVELRKAGDCMRNESWLNDPAAIAGGIAFVRKYMSNLRGSFCCEKIGVQPVCLTVGAEQLSQIAQFISKMPQFTSKLGVLGRWDLPGA